MKRTVFLLLWVIPVFASLAYGDIEIYANGHRYSSLQAYLDSKKVAAAPAPATPALLNSQQEDYIRQETQQLGMNVDFGKIKTLQINHKNLSDGALHKLYVLSIENGMVGALQDFYQAWGQSNLRVNNIISSEQLQEAIQQAVATSNEPKLLISEPGKIRIMVLTVEDRTR
jgi:hypothetical protein